jgi:pilus assembly protein CpaC
LPAAKFPIPVSQSLGAVSIEYKQYGVSLAFTPIVLADGRISMRVRPEVSELSSEGSIRSTASTFPALTTRRAETTVELGSGQSFMLAGLLATPTPTASTRRRSSATCRSSARCSARRRIRRQETELVIIVTPYLVRPVSGRLALPTDGYRAPTDAEAGNPRPVVQGVSGPAATAPARPRPSAADRTTTASPGFKL